MLLCAPVKCLCLATHYCDKECQRKNLNLHRGQCTYWLLKDINTRRRELQLLKAQPNCSSRDGAATELELARLHKLVASLLCGTPGLLSSNYELAEEHSKQALEICRSLAALAKENGSTDEDFHLDNSITNLLDLGKLYHVWHKEDDALQAY